jgi:hypothetical protein
VIRCSCLLFLYLGFSISVADPKPWVEPFKDANFEAFKPYKVRAEDWAWAETATLKPQEPKYLTSQPGKAIIVNGLKGNSPNLYTKATYGDCEIHLEFMLGKGSNSGIKFHGHYEIQLFDSFGKPAAVGEECGGIYPRAELKPKYRYLDQGVPPKVNACKAPGEWQTLTAIFLAPRFDAEKKKIAPARIVRATLNDKLIHENQELLTPTGSNHTRPEMAIGPIMLQGDHGPVSFRQFKVREYKPD